MRHWTIFLLITIFFPFHVRSQNLSESYLQGYAQEISGFTFNYHSPLTDVNSSLLVRAHQEYQPIEWQSEVIPSDYQGDFVSFIWMYAMDTDVETFKFHFSVNGEHYFTFTNPNDENRLEYDYNGKNGASLRFHCTMLDKYNDQMGFAVLTLPKSAIKLGEPVNFKVEGENAQSSIWYMTFKSPIKEKISVSQEKVIKKEGEQLFYLARFDFTHIGAETQGIVKIGDQTEDFNIKPGYNSFTIQLPKSEEKQDYKAVILIDDKETDIPFIMEPVKPWIVYLVQHSHTDIGYTRPQTEILAEHLRYIDYALDFCDQTDHYPDEAKFKWTCEAAWPVREYLKSRPQSQIDRLVKRIQEGRIEVTAMFFNYSEIVDETGLVAQTQTLRDFQEKGIKVKTAMQNDVNGIAWCLADYYPEIGVKYLIMGQHGHRARVPFDKPTAFWWESPSGKRLLAYRAEHYMYGNTLGLTSKNINEFRKNLAHYLESLEAKNYPFLITELQFSGYITDNSPPSIIASDMVKEWNEQYEWPKLQLAVANEFMQDVEEKYTDKLEIKKVAWPDWWTDGAGSAMQETKANRNTHCDMIANNGLLSMAKILGADLPTNIRQDIRDVNDALLFYDEHTYGAAESISDPLSENSVIQWNEKASYAWDAVKKSRMLKEKAMGFIQPFIPKSKTHSIAIFNTLNWNRSGLVTLYIDHEILPNNKKFKILDYNGNPIAIQALNSRSDGTYWGIWVQDIPAMGYSIYQISVEDEARVSEEKQEYEGSFENQFYCIKIDTEKGAIKSLFDKEMEKELLDQQDTMLMGQFIYERLDNRYQMERFTYNKIDTAFVPLRGEKLLLKNIENGKIVNGPVWKSLFIHGELPLCADDRGVDLEIRLYHQEKRIELLYDMHKLAVVDPEAVYVAFPFYLKDSKLAYEAQGGLVFPGINQLEGTAHDWNTIQNFASVRSEDSQIIFGSHDIPLVQFGAINTGRFYYKHQPATSHIYSWVLNNYWTTNFKASQEGQMRWTYFISSSENASNSFASRYSMGNRIPFLSRVLPASDREEDRNPKSLMTIDSPNIVIINSLPSIDGKGIVLHLRETEGKECNINIKHLLNLKATSYQEVNVLEEKITELENEWHIGAFESKFLKIIL